MRLGDVVTNASPNFGVASLEFGARKMVMQDNASFKPWPDVGTVFSICDRSQRFTGLIRDLLPTTVRKPPFGTQSQPTVFAELDKLTYLFYGRCVEDFERDERSTARLGWGHSLAGYIVATPGPKDWPELQNRFASSPMSLLHAECLGWQNPVTAHLDSLWQGLKILRVYFGQPVFMREYWLRVGTGWLREIVLDSAFIYAQQPQLGTLFDSEYCRAPIWPFRMPAQFASPMQLKEPVPLPDEIERCGTFDNQTTDGIPAEWLDEMDLHADRLRKAAVEIAGRDVVVEKQIRIVNAGTPSLPQYVTLTQMAAMVNKTKRAIEQLKSRGKLPAPGVKGGNGKADEWLWTDIRAILEREYNRSLPERFPGDRFIH